MISDLKTFNSVFETAEFWCIVGLIGIAFITKGKTSVFFNLLFLLLLSERGSSPESC